MALISASRLSCITLFMALLFLPLSSAAEVVCNKQGVVSPDGIGIYDFKIYSPQNPPVANQTIMINMTLQNQRSDAVYPQDVNYDKGIFLTIEYPNGLKLNFTQQDPALWHDPYTNTWDPNKKIGFLFTLAPVPLGTWKIWPGYRVLAGSPAQVVNGPYNWADCQFQVVAAPTPSSPSDSLSPSVTAEFVATTEERVSFILAHASDNVRVRSISIYIDNELAGACENIQTLAAECEKSKTTSSAGRHTYYAVAVDSSGNQGRTLEGYFFVTEHDPPAVNVSVIPPDARGIIEGRNATFIAEASDESGIAEIAIYLEGQQVGGTCFLTQRCVVNATIKHARKFGLRYIVSYSARALDATGQGSFTRNQSLYVRDFTPPQILNMTTFPEYPETNEQFSFIVLASDNQDIWRIQINATDSSGRLIQSWPCFYNSDTCTVRFARTEPEDVNFSVLVTDFSGNQIQGNYRVSFRFGPPVIDLVTHHPPSPAPTDEVYIRGHAFAQGSKLMRSMEVVLDGQVVQRCTHLGPLNEGTCGYTLRPPYDRQIFSYDIRAVDNEGRETISGTRQLFIVSSAVDTDNDGLPDSIENAIGTDPANRDTDRDNLPDGWEILGADADGNGFIDVDLPGMGSNPLRKDLFLELDWMEDESHTHKPQNSAIQMVVNAFERRNVSLHIDLGQWGGGNAVPHQEGVLWSSGWFNNASDERNATARKAYEDAHKAYLFEIKKQNFDLRRLGIFRWGIFTHEDEFSGDANGGGNFRISIPPDSSVGEKAGTLMHEFGHTLGFGHGGKSGPLAWDGDNYKPNYRSVMNYLYQFPGIPEVDSSGNIINIIDYSDEALADLNENSLNEVSGLVSSMNTNRLSRYTCINNGHGNRTADVLESRNKYGKNTLLIGFQLNGSPVDWNCNGRIDSGTVDSVIDGNGNTDPHDTGNGTESTLVGREDWNGIRFIIGCPDWGLNRTQYPSGFQASSCPEFAGLGNSNGYFVDEEHVDQEPESVNVTIGEICDGEDNDGDGLIDKGCPDADSDGISDAVDNCPDDPNPDQSDTNRDFIGDACAKKYKFQPEISHQHLPPLRPGLDMAPLFIIALIIIVLAISLVYFAFMRK